MFNLNNVKWGMLLTWNGQQLPLLINDMIQRYDKLDDMINFTINIVKAPIFFTDNVLNNQPSLTPNYTS